MMNITKPRSIYLFFIVLATLAGGRGSSAQENRPALATHYDVAFAYARLTDTRPDFSALLSADPAWRALSALDQMRLRADQIDDLARRFASFSPSSTLLTVRVPVRVFPTERPAGLVLGYLSPTLPYFPFWDGTQYLSLYTEDLPLLSILPLDDELAVRRAGYLISETNGLYLDLVATRRPTGGAEQVDGQPQILIATRIARARLMNKYATEIWRWENPDYRSLYRYFK